MHLQKSKFGKMMKITIIEKLSSGRFCVHFDERFPLVFYKGELLNYGIEEGAQITSAQYDTWVAEVILPRAKKRAMHLLERKDFTEAMLRRKLGTDGYPSEVIEEVVAYLYGYHYLDDHRFARHYLLVYGIRCSRRRIEKDLREKGIAEDVIAAVFEESNEEDEDLPTEEEKIMKILIQKDFSWDRADEKEKARIYRHLADILKCMRKRT